MRAGSMSGTRGRDWLNGWAQALEKNAPRLEGAGGAFWISLAASWADEVKVGGVGGGR